VHRSAARRLQSMGVNSVVLELQIGRWVKVRDDGRLVQSANHHSVIANLINKGAADQDDLRTRRG
jgi:hypothetical protein